MDKLRMQTLDGVQDNIDKIAALFPNCITERKDAEGKVSLAIDFDKLRQELSSEIVEGREERYQFTWPDKKKAILLANSPINATLRPCREESVDFDNTQNLYIEGDNLDVLKCLKETYLGKVKMIYIDPPYNTGNDFVYEDDFAESTSEYLANSGQYDEQGNRLVNNTESNGRFHTDWLNMIYPRLKVARDLLTEDGIIFISIDENEFSNLVKICNEIYGEKNYFSTIIVRSNSRGQTYKQIAKTHEYLLAITKTEMTDLFELEKDLDKSDLNLRDNVSAFNIRELRNRNPKFGKHNRPGLFYPIYINPSIIDKDGFSPVSLIRNDDYNFEVLPLNSTGGESCWRWGKQKCVNNICSNTLNSNLIAKPKSSGGFNIYEKYRKTTYKPKSIWDDNSFLTETGTVEVRKLGFTTEFDFPKPVELIKRCIELSSQDEDIIVDFFAGSSTTAQAVLEMNVKDKIKRRFIMIQLPVPIDINGYQTICDVGKERIRRVGKKIKEELEAGKQENGRFAEQEEKQTVDIGFRVLKLDSSNMEDIYYSPAEYNQQTLFTKTESVKSDRTSEDLLFQVMLELGATLDSKIEQIEIGGKTIYNVATNYLVACFDNEINDSVVATIAKMQPQYAVFRDSSMANDSTATNFEQIFKTYSPNTVTKVL